MYLGDFCKVLALILAWDLAGLPFASQIPRQDPGVVSGVVAHHARILAWDLAGLLNPGVGSGGIIESWRGIWRDY